MPPQRIYLDNNATTLIDPSVVEVMIRELKELPSNPSSVHYEGRQARARLMKARESIASVFSVKPSEIYFTSGGTEGANLILQGFAAKNPKAHIITSDLEHSCIYKTAKHLAEKGHPITFISPGIKGAASIEEIKNAILPETKLIFIAAVNAETGVKINLKEIAELAQGRGIQFAIDAVALFGKENFSLNGVAAAIFSGHKFHGPKGVGFCVIKKDLRLEPMLLGGHQEYLLRAGTENLPGVIGLAAAVGLAQEKLPENSAKILYLRNLFERLVLEHFNEAQINGGDRERVVNVSNIAFSKIEGELLLTLLDREGISASLGSACASGSLQPSRVLINMGFSQERAASSIRFSLSRFTTEKEILDTIAVLKRIKEGLV